MTGFSRTVFAFLVALAVGTVGVAAAHTHFVLNELRALGEEVPLALQLETTLGDIVGLAPTLVPLLAIGFLIAFAAAGLLARFTVLRTIVFLVAGAVAVLTIHASVKILLDVTGIAGARTLMGMIAQGGAGALAGLAFAMLKPAGE